MAYGDEPRLLELAHGFAQRVSICAVLRRELALARQSLARLQLSAQDLPAKLHEDGVCDIGVAGFFVHGRGSGRGSAEQTSTGSTSLAPARTRAREPTRGILRGVGDPFGGARDVSGLAPGVEREASLDFLYQLAGRGGDDRLRSQCPCLDDRFTAVC